MGERSFPHAKKPCDECPWRMDVAPGRFPPERFVALAETAYDLSGCVFACHKSPDGRAFACAGFLRQSAAHNLSVRLAARAGRIDLAEIGDGGAPLYPDYVAMAVANGVRADDPALHCCRLDGQIE